MLDKYEDPLWKMWLDKAGPLVQRHQENIQHGNFMQLITAVVIIQRSKLWQ